MPVLGPSSIGSKGGYGAGIGDGPQRRVGSLAGSQRRCEQHRKHKNTSQLKARHDVPNPVLRVPDF